MCFRKVIGKDCIQKYLTGTDLMEIKGACSTFGDVEPIT